MDRQAILDEVIEYTRLPRLEDDEFTVTDYMLRYQETEGTHLPRHTARDRLAKLVGTGRLQKRLVFQNGKLVNAYRLTDEISHSDMPTGSG